MFDWKRLTVIFSLCAAAAAPAHSQTPAPACEASEHRQLDFWVGDWRIDYDLPNGGIGEATNKITRDEFGDCVVAEHFTMPGGYKGASYSIYDPKLGAWRQTWVDNQGGVFVLTGGPTQNADHDFELVTTEPVGADNKVRRMIWKRQGDDALVWRWQSKSDTGWDDRWVLRYHRAGSAG